MWGGGLPLYFQWPAQRPWVGEGLRVCVVLLLVLWLLLLLYVRLLLLVGWPVAVLCWCFCWWVLWVEGRHGRHGVLLARCVFSMLL